MYLHKFSVEPLNTFFLLFYINNGKMIVPHKFISAIYERDVFISVKTYSLNLTFSRRLQTCVAQAEMRFSVRGFGCALFYFGEKY